MRNHVYSNRLTGLLNASIMAMLLTVAFQAQALTFEKSVPQATQTQVLSDLNFMSSLTGQNPSNLHQQVFGQMDGTGYGSWFSSRVLRVGYDNSDAGGAVAYVSPFFDPSRMVLTRNYTKFSHPQIARMMVVYHEARHTETRNSSWPHATCPTPFLDENGQEIKSIWTGMPLAGEDGCDDSAIGAYGSSVILLENIALHCGNCSEKVKMDAKLYGDDQLKRVTNASAASEIRQDLHVR